MSRILSKALDEASEHLADKITPVLMDTFQRLEGLTFDYDRGNWETVMAAITEKLPQRLGKMPMSKQDRLEILSAVDFLDRSVGLRGNEPTAQAIFKSVAGMFDVFDSFRKFVGLRVKDVDGQDVTEDVFG